MFGLKLLDSNWIVKSRSGKHTRQPWMEDIRIINSEHPKRIRETSFWMNPCWIFFWFTHYFVIKAMNHVMFQAVKNRRFFKPLLCLGVQLLGTHGPGRSRRSKLRVHVAKWCKIQSVIICIHRWCVSGCVCSNKEKLRYWPGKYWFTCWDTSFAYEASSVAGAHGIHKTHSCP